MPLNSNEIGASMGMFLVPRLCASGKISVTLAGSCVWRVMCRSAGQSDLAKSLKGNLRKAPSALPLDVVLHGRAHARGPKLPDMVSRRCSGGFRTMGFKVSRNLVRHPDQVFKRTHSDGSAAIVRRAALACAS